MSEKHVGETSGDSGDMSEAVTAADTGADTATGAVAAEAAAEEGGAGAPWHRRRRNGLIGLAVLAAVVGAVGSWVYNSGYQTRASDNSAVIRAGADPSTYVTPGDLTKLTVPIRNDSPDAVTVVGLVLPSAQKIRWDGKETVIQPGETVYLQVNAPSSCAAVPHVVKKTTTASVLLNVQTANGMQHPRLRLSVSGVIVYAADYCAPAPKPTATTKA